MASTIRIKRSGTAGNPSTLGAGELAYSAADASSVSGGDRLYVGFGTETNGNAANHIVIGGEYFTSKLDHTLGALTADSAVLVDSNKKINEFFVDNLGFDGNTISSTDTNGDVNIVANGTGQIYLTGTTVHIGPPSGGGNITTSGLSDLTLSTNDGTNSGTIVIQDGTNGNINITPDGSGEVNISNVDIDGGSIDGVAIGTTTPISEFEVDNLRLDGNSITSTNVDGVVRIAPNGNGDFQVESDKFRLGSLDENVAFTTYGTGDLTINTNGGTDSGSIFIPSGIDGSITVEPNGAGNVILSTDTTIIGDLDALAKLTTQGTGSLVIDTNDGADSGTITLNHGTNSDIVFEPNGTGRTIAHNLFVDDGTTNRSIQEFVEDITGGQIQGTTDVVSVTYDDGAGTSTIDLVETAVTAGSYGSSTKIPTFTVDADGRLTAAGEEDVATDLSITGDTGSATVDLLNDTFNFTGGTSVSTTVTSGTTDAVKIDVADASTTVKGIASFDSNNFTVSSGAVSAKDITLGSSTLTLGSTTSALAGLTQLDVDNIRINGNTIFSTDTDGDIILSPNATSSTTPGVVNVDDSRIINLNEPVNPKDAANKRYVDEVAQGLQALPAADLATTANLTATYDNGTDGVGATLTATSNGAFPTVDGVQLQEGENILVKDQNNEYENGSYILTDAGDASNPWVLTRCSFCDEEEEITGAFEFVAYGNNNGNTGWVATVPTDFLIGSTDPTSDSNGFDVRGDIVWVQFSGAGTFTAGTNLNLDGTEFNLDDNITIVDLVSSGTVEFTSTDELVLDSGGNIVSAPFTVSGGAVFEKDTITGGVATFTDATDSTSTTTGSVVVEGGVGVAKTMYVGDDIVGSGAATSLIDGFEIDGGTY